MAKEYSENVSVEEESSKKGIVKNVKNYYILGGLILLFIVSFFIFFSSSNEGKDVSEANILICGDGTFYSDCSLDRPYYCDGGDLVYEPFLCGCPESLEKIGDSCSSQYFTDPQDVSLKYFLNGEEKEISFETYGGVSEYLDTLERTVTYVKGEIPRRADFKLKKINDDIQRDALMELVVKIQNLAPNSLVDQARIATSIVQNIEYKESEFGQVGNFKIAKIRLARYPYQVVEGGVGSCEGKSELLVFLLREIGYGTAVFYYNAENHEAVGIKCPIEESLMNTGYCFVETTVAAPISYSTGTYLIGDSSGGKLGIPEVVVLGSGISLPRSLVEYSDVDKIESVFEDGRTNIIEREKLDPLYSKYGMQ